jgi:predicted metalloprotease
MTEIRMKSGSSSTACGFAAWSAQHAAKPQAADEREYLHWDFYHSGLIQRFGTDTPFAGSWIIPWDIICS